LAPVIDEQGQSDDRGRDRHDPYQARAHPFIFNARRRYIHRGCAGESQMSRGSKLMAEIMVATTTPQKNKMPKRGSAVASPLNFNREQVMATTTTSSIDQ